MTHSFVAAASVLIASVALAGSLGGRAEASPRPKAVIELFTSQGCSSCPPADELMGKLATRSDVIALSYSVDYWDYLGWKDTLASHSNTERQRAYAIARGDGQIYTPQAVVNGVAHAVGSRDDEIEAAIRATADEAARINAPVALREDGKDLVVEIGAAPAGSQDKQGTVWLASVTGKAEITIKRGENAGRSVVYHNVVRKLTPIGTWSGQAASYRVPMHDLMSDSADGCAVLVQAGEAGPIIGAAALWSW